MVDGSFHLLNGGRGRASKARKRATLDRSKPGTRCGILGGLKAKAVPGGPFLRRHVARHDQHHFVTATRKRPFLYFTSPVKPEWRLSLQGLAMDGQRATMMKNRLQAGLGRIESGWSSTETKTKRRSSGQGGSSASRPFWGLETNGARWMAGAITAAAQTRTYTHAHDTNMRLCKFGEDGFCRNTKGAFFTKLIFPISIWDPSKRA